MNVRPDELPPKAWQVWTIWLPCLLTFPVLVVYILAIQTASLMNCFDTCVHRSMGRVDTAAACELLLAIAALVLLVTGAQWRARRRAIVAAAWVVCVIAYGIPVVMAAFGLN